MPLVKVGDINLCYNVRGNGKPLVFINGFGSAQNITFALVRTFSKHYRIVTFDNRGIGGSDKPAGPYTTKMMADDTIALMDSLGIDKAHILGGSMGGMIAQEIAIDHPKRVDRLVLFCTSAGGQTLWDSFFDLIEASVPGWKRSNPDLSGADLGKFMIEMFSRSFDGKLFQALFLPLLKLQARHGKLKAPIGQLEAMLSHNTLDRLDKIQAPTLVLAGGRDRVMPPQSSQDLVSKIKGARLVVIEDGAHALMGKRFNKEVMDFLK